MQRKTQQRDTILQVMQAADRPLSPTEILTAAQSQTPGLGIATVYRALKEFSQSGLVETVELPGASDRYEIVGKDHHHHFWCRECDRVYDVEGCSGNVGTNTPRGFRAEDHDVLIKGLCAKCVS